MNLTKPIKQGCVLAPMLFNLFLNDLASSLEEVDGHGPKLGTSHVPLLLYVDDAALISRTRIGLKHLLNRAAEYFESNKLLINYAKSKIMVFTNRWRAYKWSCNGNSLEQVKHFKYLGVNFHYRLTWTSHWKAILNDSELSSLVNSRFFFTSGNGYVPAALDAYRGKVLSQVLYAAPVWHKSTQSLGSVQASFLWKILGVPRCVPYAALCLETGLIWLKTIALLRSCKFWFRILFNPTGLMFQLCSDMVLPVEVRDLLNKIKFMGFEASKLGIIDRDAAYRTVRKRILDIEQQELFSAARSTCSSLYPHVSGDPDSSPDRGGSQRGSSGGCGQEGRGEALELRRAWLERGRSPDAWAAGATRASPGWPSDRWRENPGHGRVGRRRERRDRGGAEPPVASPAPGRRSGAGCPAKVSPGSCRESALRDR